MRENVRGVQEPKPIPIEDLEDVLRLTRASFLTLRGARIFVTGGTGFFGHWLLESILHANQELSLQVRITVLTRSSSLFRLKAPHIAQNSAVTLLEGNIRSFPFPGELHTHILHAATDSTGAQADTPAYQLAESILDGTRRVLQFARIAGTQRLLYVSSGAVYGRGITDVTHIPETYPGAPDPLLLQSSYDEAKRMAEHICVAYSANTSLECTIARCFAFVGPHLPLDQHFAIGNFIRDVLAARPIHIKGDGTPLRSFLYMSDLAAWLWTLLLRGERDRAYNVGSDQAVSIGDLARTVARTLRPELPVKIDGTPDPAVRPATYVPDITRAAKAFGLGVTVPLAEAIRKTAAWHGFAPDSDHHN